MIPPLPTVGAFAKWPHDPGAGHRKAGARARLRILQEDFRESVFDRIVKTHMDPEVRARIQRFVSVVLNPGRDITNAVAMVYDLGVRRVLKGASEEQQLAFAALVTESEAAIKATSWNRYAFLLGPTIVVPVVRAGKMRLELVRPDTTDVLADPDDPLGTPKAAVWTAHGGGADYVMLDGEAWRYLNERGEETLDANVHGLGYFPGAVFRLDEPCDGWWPHNYQERLTDATTTVAYQFALMQWVRKSQNKNLLVVVGETGDIAKGQLIDPELALTIESRTSNSTTVQVADFNTSPNHFLDEIRFTVEAIIESYGIPQSAVTFDTSSEGGFMGASIKKEKLGHLREAQIPFFDRGERDLWPKVVAVARAASHRLAGKLPPADEVADMFEAQWPTLKVVDDPLQREALYRERLRRGGVSPLDMIQEDHPKLTRAECRALLQENVGDYAWLADAITSRGLVMDLQSGLMASSEALGRMGPAVRDGKAPAPVAAPAEEMGNTP